MTDSNIYVDHNALDNTSQRLTSDVKAIQTVLDDLDTQIQKLIANWEGSAQTAYQQAKSQWTQAMTNMNTTLSSISSLLSETNDTFRAIDAKGAQSFEGFKA